MMLHHRRRSRPVAGASASRSDSEQERALREPHGPMSARDAAATAARTFSTSPTASTDGINGETAGLFGAIADVPEPSTWALMPAGLGGLAFAARRRDHQQRAIV